MMKLVKTKMINIRRVKGNVKMLDNSQNKNTFSWTNELPIRFHRMSVSNEWLSKIEIQQFYRQTIYPFLVKVFKYKF